MDITTLSISLLVGAVEPSIRLGQKRSREKRKESKSSEVFQNRPRMDETLRLTFSSASSYVPSPRRTAFELLWNLCNFSPPSR